MSNICNSEVISRQVDVQWTDKLLYVDH